MTRVSTIDPIQFKIVDFTLWIPGSRYWIQDSLLVKLGFWIPVVSGSSDSLCLNPVVVGSLFISGSFFYYYRVDAIPDVDFRMRYDVIASRPCRADFSCYEFSNYRKPVFPNSNSIRDSRPPEDSKEHL